MDVHEAVAVAVSDMRRVAKTENVRVADALGRVSAANVFAPVDLPPFPCSAMDGYAVRSTDLGPGSTRLSQIGTSWAGHPFDRALGAGECVRIMTGAWLPAGADAVVIQENAHAEGTDVEVLPVAANTHVRPVGHDVRAGSTVLTTGRRINPFDIGWLSACGVATTHVYARPRVAVLSTGDELVPPGASLEDGQIYDSNRITILSLIDHLPVDCIDLGVVPDDADAIESALTHAAGVADLIVTSGGVSVGDADLVRLCLEKLGELTFWRLNLKPGKPLAVGHINTEDGHRCSFFGLPGNPVSTIVCLLLVVKPALLRLCGARPWEPLRLPAVAAQPLSHEPGRTEFQRGTVFEADSRLMVSATGDQSSNRLHSFSTANCLIEIEKESAGVPAGASVRVLPFSSLLD